MAPITKLTCLMLLAAVTTDMGEQSVADRCCAQRVRRMGSKRVGSCCMLRRKNRFGDGPTPTTSRPRRAIKPAAYQQLLTRSL